MKENNIYILVDYSNHIPEKITEAKAKELISLGCLVEETAKQDGVRSWYGDTIDGWEYLVIEIA